MTFGEENETSEINVRFDHRFELLKNGYFKSQGKYLRNFNDSKHVYLHHCFFISFKYVINSQYR